MSNVFKATRKTQRKALRRVFETTSTEYWYDLGNNTAIRLAASSEEEAEGFGKEIDKVVEKFKGGALEWFSKCGNSMEKWLETQPED